MHKNHLRPSCPCLENSVWKGSYHRLRPSLSTLTSPPPSLVASFLNREENTSQYGGFWHYVAFEDLYWSIAATCFQTTKDKCPATTRPSLQFQKSTLRQVARLQTTHQVRLALDWVLILSFLKTSLQVRTNRRAGGYIWESEGSTIDYVVYLVDSNDTARRAKVIL